MKSTKQKKRRKKTSENDENPDEWIELANSLSMFTKSLLK